MRPVVDGLVKKYAGKYDIRIMNSSVTDPNLVSKLASLFSIRFVPTFVFLNSDGSLNQTVVGAVPVSRIEKELAKLT
jgi:thiol-disulfide isomerase/thioredoxin